MLHESVVPKTGEQSDIKDRRIRWAKIIVEAVIINQYIRYLGWNSISRLENLHNHFYL